MVFTQSWRSTEVGQVKLGEEDYSAEKERACLKVGKEGKWRGSGGKTRQSITGHTVISRFKLEDNQMSKKECKQAIDRKPLPWLLCCEDRNSVFQPIIGPWNEKE